MDIRTTLIHVPSTGRTTKWGTATFSGSGRVLMSIFSPVADRHSFIVEDWLMIGRSDEERPDLQVNLQAFGAVTLGVSRQHARLERFGSHLMLTDLNSSNGTFINGVKCLPLQARLVRDGDEIKLGKLILFLYFEKNIPVRSTQNGTVLSG